MATVNTVSQADYNNFAENIESGFGWIDPNDIARQWAGLNNYELTSSELAYVTRCLEANGLIREDADEIDEEEG